jgi:uncharacterized membrane protein YvlD (DUF360 family)
MHVLVSWLFLAAGLWIIAQILPGFRIRGFQGALWVGAVFGILHFTIGWLVFVVIGVSTLFLGFIFAFITWWIVSAILLKVTDALSDNIEIDSFRTALIASLLLSALSSLRVFVLHQ